jgi:hypothetical protein
MAEFDLKVPATVRNCDTEVLPSELAGEITYDDPITSYEDCYGAGTSEDRPLLTQEAKDSLPTVNVDVYQKNGNIFVGAHAGFVYRFSVDMGIQLNANLNYTLPKSTLIIEPTLGFVYGL